MGGHNGSRADTEGMHWARGLGEARHASDASAARSAKSSQDDAVRTAEVSGERWAAIVVAIRRVVDAYNAGAGRAVLEIVEPSGQQAVTVATGGGGAPYLTAALEDTLICVHGRDADGLAYATDVRLRPDRSDDATAAYLLQNWMQHL